MRLATVTVLATAVMAVSAGPAMADASISITTAAGTSDAVSFIPRIFTVSGTAPGATRLFVKHRAIGGASCAPSPYLDPGSSWTGFYNLPVNGAFSFPKAITWDAPGSWMFCFWLGADERAISTPIQQTVIFRPPTGSMSASVSPLLIRPNQRALLTVAGTSEAPRNLYAKVRRVGSGPCATSYDVDPGTSLISGEGVNGAFSGDAITVQSTPGSYFICAWLAGPASDPAPIAITAASFTVQAKKPVVASVQPLNCSTRGLIRRFKAADVRSVCIRYRFSTRPYPGQRLLVSYVTPKKKTYKTVTARWPTGDTKTIIPTGLPAKAYKHRRGTWRAVLRLAGKEVKTVSFKVL